MPRSLSKSLPKPPPSSSTSSPSSTSPLIRLVRLLFTIYLFIALLYTAYHFILEPVLSGLGLLPSSLSPPPSPPLPARKPESKGDPLWAAAEQGLAGTSSRRGKKTKYVPPPAELHRNFPWAGYGEPARVLHPGLDFNSSDGEVVHWWSNVPTVLPGDDLASGPYTSAALQEAGINAAPGQPIVMAEDFFLSKVFGESLQPSKVVPYYYRAKGPLEKEDVTITTLVTSNRFEVFAELVERYQGPISVTIHATDDPVARRELLSSLHDLYMSSPSMSRYVDIHLVIDPFERQFNMWRNVARFFARTAYVMMLDVDFWICTDFRSRLLNSPEIMAKLREGTAAFVVPAFEYTLQKDGTDPSTFPKDKSELLELVKEDKIGMFHKSWQPGHGSTNYTRFYEAREGEVYRARTYAHAYEPYVIFKKEGTPFCDERFVGYGANKAACLFELYISGVSYYILPDDFLIHRSHAYAEVARKHERKYNRKLYADFREEICFRYLRANLDHIDEPRSKNLLLECKKIKGFTNTASKLIAAHSAISA